MPSPIGRTCSFWPGMGVTCRQTNPPVCAASHPRTSELASAAAADAVASAAAADVASLTTTMEPDFCQRCEEVQHASLLLTISGGSDGAAEAETADEVLACA